MRFKVSNRFRTFLRSRAILSIESARAKTSVSLHEVSSKDCIPGLWGSPCVLTSTECGGETPAVLSAHCAAAKDKTSALPLEDEDLPGAVGAGLDIAQSRDMEERGVEETAVEQSC